MILATILIIAAGTFLTRALPFLLLKDEKLPQWLDAIVDALPYATIGLLVVYSLKDTNTTNLLATVLSLVFLVGIHLWKRNTILSIVASTILYMICVQIGL